MAKTRKKVREHKTRKKPHSEILTVMFIDIVSYTKTTANLSRERFDELHETFDELSLPVFEKHEGTVIKKIGDAFMITFKTATDAVLCGMDLQNTFRSYNREYKLKMPLQIRVALHAGEVLVRKGDVYGDTVNTAARIEGIASANDIYFSESVYNAMNKKEIPYLFIGQRKLKGLKVPLRIFRVKNSLDRKKERQRKLKRMKKRFYRFLWKIFALAALLGLLIFIYVYLIRNFY